MKTLNHDGSTVLLGCCELHSKKEKKEYNTCPICLWHIHKQTCKERDELKQKLCSQPAVIERDRLLQLLSEFPGFDVSCSIGDHWIEKARAEIRRYLRN